MKGTVAPTIPGPPPLPIEAPIPSAPTAGEPESEEVKIAIRAFPSAPVPTPPPPPFESVTQRLEKKDLPSVTLELPEIGSQVEVRLHSLPLTSSREIQFSLDTSAAVAPKNMGFVMQRQKETAIWQISFEPISDLKEETRSVLDPNSSTARPIAEFRLVDGQLRFRWLSTAPDSIQVVNCVAKLASNEYEQKLFLRRPQSTRGMTVALSKSPPMTETGISALPKADRIELVLEKVEGVDENITLTPKSGRGRIGSRLKVRPQHSLNVELDLNIQLRGDDLLIQARPSFLLSENNRQDFTAEKIKSVFTVTAARLQKDLERFSQAQSRARSIPSDLSRIYNADAQPAAKAAAIASLQREAKSAESTIKSLSTAIPRTQETLKQLDLYHKYAESLDGKLKIIARIVALADTAEIPLWISD
jgi:hypothetical protein